MNSLQRHGPRETHKQLHLRMQRSGLSSIKVHVTRRAGKLKFHFTGSDGEVKKAEQILADWNETEPANSGILPAGGPSELEISLREHLLSRGSVAMLHGSIQPRR